ncbi:hypothetical protein BKA70DRAFT_1255103 [Coprinopsis sp. MPI-PUGE-AT-0042]|nr:hypothetical protein BKA70DRAFT_1255103 [Coprinopsis sp. MPI-PUGE-AT-0042]
MAVDSELLHQQRLQKATTEANLIAYLFALTVIVLEYFENFQGEVVLIWPSKWGLVKFFYFANRLLPFFVLPFGITYYTIAQSDATPVVCAFIFGTAGIGAALCMLMSEVILYLRLYALSGRQRWVKNFIIVNGTLIFVVCIGALSTYMGRSTWGPSQFPGFFGCVGKPNKNALFVVVAYLTILYSGLVTVILCAYFGIRHYWESRESRLVVLFYRDSMLYFVVLAAMSITNLAAVFTLPPRFKFVVAHPQAMMHSVLAARMVLHLRVEARLGMGFNNATVSKTMAFAPRMPTSSRSGDTEDTDPTTEHWQS